MRATKGAFMKKKTIIISSIILVFVAIIFVVDFDVNKDETPETSVSSTLETHKSTSISTTTSFESESTTNETTTFVTTTTKKASVTKSESTTKKNSTTKGNKNVTYNGYKPYEVFVDASKGGNSYYYDENGRLYCAEALTAVPKEPTDECPLCGKENCGAYIKPWHCVVCDKDIATDECHPLSHLKKSL